MVRARGPDHWRRRSRSSLGTPKWLLRWTVYYGSRTVLNLLRAVPELVWALIFVVAVGLGPFPGVLALARPACAELDEPFAVRFELDVLA